MRSFLMHIAYIVILVDAVDPDNMSFIWAPKLLFFGVPNLIARIVTTQAFSGKGGRATGS